MAEHTDETEGYTGAGVAVIDDVEHTVQLILSGHFEPISGSYLWYGRVRELPETPRGTTLLLCVTEDNGDIAQAQARVTERDLWNHHMVTGLGAPPFSAFDTSVL